MQIGYDSKRKSNLDQIFYINLTQILIINKFCCINLIQMLTINTSN